MADKRFPFLEATLVAENSISRNPGDFFINSEGQAYTVLEDGTLQPLRDKTYYDMLYMLENNKPVTLQEFDNLEKANLARIHLKGDILPEGVVTESVHNIHIDVEQGNTRRLVSFTLGEDVEYNTNTTLETVLYNIMKSSLELDEYFDKDNSSTHILSDANNSTIHSIKLRFRKCTSVLSDNEENYINMLLTGEAALELMAILRSTFVSFNRYNKITVSHRRLDSNGDILENTFDMNAVRSDDTLEFHFNEKDDVIGSKITEDTIELYHSTSPKITIDISSTENSINVLKSLTTTDTGHLVSYSTRNLEVDGDMSRMFFSRNIMNMFFVNKKNNNVSIIGSVNIVNDLTTGEFTEVTVHGSMIVEGKQTILNTVNTEYTEPVITLDAEDKTISDYGIQIHTFNDTIPWQKNTLRLGNIYAHGGDVSVIENANESLSLLVDLNYLDLSNYTPEYLGANDTLRRNFYVSDIFIDMRAADVNTILAHAALDDINNIPVTNSRVYIAMLMNNLQNIAPYDISVFYSLEYRKYGETSYKSFFENTKIVPNISILQQLQNIKLIPNIESVRFRIHTQIRKSYADTIKDSKSYTFTLNGLMMYPTNLENETLTYDYINKYTKTYLEGVRDRVTAGATVVSADIVPVSNLAVSGDTESYAPFAFSIHKDLSIIENIDGVDFLHSKVKIDYGYSNLYNPSTKKKILKVNGVFFATYSDTVSTSEKDIREKTGFKPNIQPLKIYIDLYMLPFSSTILKVGSKITEVDNFGRPYDIEEVTQYADFSRDSPDIIKIENIPVSGTSIDNMKVIDTTLYVDMSAIADTFSNDVEYYKNKFSKEKYYIQADVKIGRPADANVDGYVDKIIVNNLSVYLQELDVEYRSCLNNSVVDPDMYTPLYTKLTNPLFMTTPNSVNDSTFSLSGGIKELSIVPEGVNLSLSKGSAMPYSHLGIRRDDPVYERKVFMIKQRMNKGVNNLLKCIMNFKDIPDFPHKNLAKIHVVLSAVTESGLQRIRKYVHNNLIGDTFFPDSNGISKLTRDSVPYALFEAQDFVSTILKDNEYNDIFDTEFYVDDTRKIFYYDINNLKDNVELVLEYYIDVAYPKDDSYKNINLIISELKTLLFTDNTYRDIEPSSGYFKKYAATYSDNDGMLHLVESSYNSENKLEAKTKYTNFKAGRYIGGVDKAKQLSKPINLVFKELANSEYPAYEGSLKITGNTEYEQLVDLTMKLSTTENLGYIGLVNIYELEENLVRVPDNTTYSAAAIKPTVEKLFLLNNISSGDIVYTTTDNEGNLVYLEPSPETYNRTLAATSAVFDYYNKVVQVIGIVNAYAVEQDRIMRESSKHIVDVSLFHKEWFMFDGTEKWKRAQRKDKKGSKRGWEYWFAAFRYTTYFGGVSVEKVEPGVAHQALESNFIPTMLKRDPLVLDKIGFLNGVIPVNSGADGWVKRTDETTIFMTHYSPDKLLSNQIDLTQSPVNYEGYISTGVTAAKIRLKFEDFKAKYKVTDDWWRHDICANPGNITKKAYAVQYKAYQGDLCIWDSGIVEHDYFVSKDATVKVLSIDASSAPKKKILGRQPFKITKTSYTQRNYLHNATGHGGAVWGAWGKAGTPEIHEDHRGSILSIVVSAFMGAVGGVIGFAIGGVAGAVVGASALGGISLSMQNYDYSQDASMAYGKSSSLVYGRPYDIINLFEKVEVEYNEFYTFPWLSPQAQDIIAPMSLQGVKVYQSLKFEGYYMKDAAGKIVPCIVTHPTRDYSYCYIDDITHLVTEYTNIPTDAICSFEAYRTSAINSENEDDNKTTLYFIDLAKFGSLPICSAMVEIYDPAFREDKDVTPPVRLYPESVEVLAISDTYVSSYINPNLYPNIQISLEISDHAPSTTLKSGTIIKKGIYDKNYKAFGTVYNVDSNGSLYTTASPVTALSYTRTDVGTGSTFIIDRYKCIARLVTKDNTCVIRDNRLTEYKEINTDPIIIPSLDIKLLYKQKLSEEVPE